MSPQGMSTTEPVITGLHTTVAFTEVMPVTCRSYFSWKTKSLFSPPPLFLNGCQARENDAGFARSCSTRAPHHRQQENHSQRDPLRWALSYRGTHPIYTLSCPEKSKYPRGHLPARWRKLPGTRVPRLPFLGQQRKGGEEGLCPAVKEKQKQNIFGK